MIKGKKRCENGVITLCFPSHKTFYARLKAERVPGAGFLAMDTCLCISIEGALVFRPPPFWRVSGASPRRGNHVPTPTPSLHRVVFLSIASSISSLSSTRSSPLHGRSLNAFAREGCSCLFEACKQLGGPVDHLPVVGGAGWTARNT